MVTDALSSALIATSKEGVLNNGSAVRPVISTKQTGTRPKHECLIQSISLNADKLNATKSDGDIVHSSNWKLATY